MTDVRIYLTRAEADAAVAAQPGKTYLHPHAEGRGADDFRIAEPGRAADRIRARGVVTERPLAVLTTRDLRPCVPVPAVVTSVRRTGPGGAYDERVVAPGADALAVPYEREAVAEAEVTKR